jgi:NAD(P)-dependent dehydrogenase (short-subunit alcohol dehydrogenase family)
MLVGFFMILVDSTIVAVANPAIMAALDITDYDAVSAFGADIHSRHPAMDVVMNIAGISAWGTVDNLTHHHWRSMVDVNLMGPIHVIETFIPPMVSARRGGRLVNVSSAAGIVALPWHAAYSASKYGLRGVSEVLRFDLARHRIGVSVVVPGAVDTPLVQTVQIAGIDRDDPGVQRWVRRFSGHAVTPEKAAEKQGESSALAWLYQRIYQRPPSPAAQWPRGCPCRPRAGTGWCAW